MHRSVGIKRELASTADQRILRWFGHVERMDELVQYGQEGVDGRLRGRPRMDGVKVELSKRGMTVEAAR